MSTIFAAIGLTFCLLGGVALGLKEPGLSAALVLLSTIAIASALHMARKEGPKS